MSEMTTQELEGILYITNNALARERLHSSMSPHALAMWSSAANVASTAVERLMRLEEEAALHSTNTANLASRLSMVESDRDCIRIRLECVTTELRVESELRADLRKHCDTLVARLADANGRLEQLTALANLFATCPACNENPCIGSCSFEHDCPDDYELMRLARLALEEV